MSSESSHAPQLQSANLADEANHRIANHLAMLAAMMRLHGKGIGEMHKALRAEEVRLILEEFAGRLETVGKSHWLLAHGSCKAQVEIAEYLKAIVDGLVPSLTVEGQMTVHCLFPATCVLPTEKAVALGLLVGELVTNAIKYAHPAGVAGTIKIEASDPGDGTIVIEVTDDGVGLPDGFDPVRSQSLGFRTIRLLAKQLRGSIAFENYGLGLNCELRFPRSSPCLAADS
jgi:two-component sensor histidine kinase